MHEAAKIKPVVIDESLVDLESLLLAREQGYSGVALKACKGHTEALLMGAAAQKYQLFLCVQDLTCIGAFVPALGQPWPPASPPWPPSKATAANTAPPATRLGRTFPRHVPDHRRHRPNRRAERPGSGVLRWGERDWRIGRIITAES
jgi:hypothetical protein